MSLTREELNARRREWYRRLRSTPEGVALLKAKRKQWYDAHKKEINEKAKKNRARYREYKNRWIAKNRDKVLETRRKWVKKNREKVREIKERWEKKNPEKVKAMLKRKYEKRRLREMIDPDYYAHVRALRRIQLAKRLIAKGLLYRPKYGKRMPDWSVRGQNVLDCGSKWLATNLTVSQRDYVKHLYLERYGKG